jgi:acyl-CoA hydrolase
LSEALEPRPVAESRSELIRSAGVQDANTAGFVHGGMTFTEPIHVGELVTCLVALDDQGRPTPVPGVLTETDDEQRRRREAKLRRANRLAERNQILQERG